MATTKTGKVIRQGGGCLITEALPDSPIYKRGFVIGGYVSKKSLPATKENNSKNVKKK